jgi:hypothetical protein
MEGGIRGDGEKRMLRNAKRQEHDQEDQNSFANVAQKCTDRLNLSTGEKSGMVIRGRVLQVESLYVPEGLEGGMNR